MNWKDIVKRGQCVLGFHSGEWHYIRASDCGQTQVCANCGVTNRRVEHIWGEWERTQADCCEETRACSRCGKTEQRVVHDWGAPEFLRGGSCKRVQTCTRCGAKESLAAEHQWAHWEAVDEGTCAEVLVCGRCGVRSDQQRAAHAWGDWEYNEAAHAAVRACRRCGELITRDGQARADLSVTAAPRAAGHSLGELVQKRDAMMEPLWQVEEQARPDAAEVERIARETVRQMQQLLQQWQATPEANADAAETGKLYRYLGDALSSLSGKRDKKLLGAACDAYRKGEPLLKAAGDPLALAKLNYNLAVALQFMAAGREQKLIEEARQRYHAACETFRTEMPEAVEQVEAALQLMEVQSRALRHFETAQRQHDQLQTLNETLENAVPDDNAADEKVAGALREMEATKASPREQLDQFRSFFEQASEVLPASKDPGYAAKTRAQLAEMSKEFSGGAGDEADEAATAIFAEMEKAEQRGEIDPQRAASLRAVMQQFQGVMREPAKTP